MPSAWGTAWGTAYVRGPRKDGAASPAIDLVTYPKDRIVVEDVMRRFGGSFVKLLAVASVNADNGIHFVKALMDCRGAADEFGTSARLQRGFPDLWAVLEMPEAERLGHLYDALPEIFDRYCSMAQAEVPS